MRRLLCPLSLIAFAACSGDTVDLNMGPSADAGTDAATSVDMGAGDGGRADAGSPGDGGSRDVQISTTAEVMTTAGPTRGVEDGDLRVFRGIPFAEPPTGDRRFRAPVPVESWPGVHDANDYGPACPQASLGPEFLLGNFSGPTSEDCLTLNVWAHTDQRARPVMVFIHGGGFVLGASSWPIYESSDLARRADVVVVTVNYRLGALGFLSTDALAAESGTAGNYGVLDMIESLRWVRENIAAFGGDPENVTIFGESAGAISVCALLGAPAADDLFHKAIIESGACAIPWADRADGIYLPARAGGERMAAELGCDNTNDPVRCLRTVSTDDLVGLASIGAILGADLETLGAMTPSIDGEVIVEQPLRRLARPEADKPLIVGSNADEGLLFAGSDVVLTRRGFERAIEGYVNDEDLAADLADLYPRREFPLVGDAWVAFLGEVVFICPGLFAASAASGGAPAFTYHFTRSPLLTRAVGSPHGIEMVYLFNTFSAMAILPTGPDRRVSETMQRAWSDFAYFGVPALSPRWPAYDPAAPQIAVIDDPAEIVDQIRGGRCEALADAGLVLR